jgi:hypothetical protein
MVQVFINNKLYKEAQTVSYSLDAGETEIFGIDSPYPQEIHSTRATVTGSISGIRIRLSGGLQAYNARPLITDLVKAEYISIRIVDRVTKEDILFIPNAKISRQNFQAQAKGLVRMSFDFKGLVGFEPLDRA